MNTLSAFMAKPDIGGAGYLTSMIPSIDLLRKMVYEEPHTSGRIRAWTDLLSGQFIPLFMRITTALKEDDDERWLTGFRNLELLGSFMVHPNILERCPRMTADEFDPPKLGSHPIVITMWTRFWISLDWAQRTQDARKERPTVDICDYPSCSSSARGPHDPPMQCSGCYSVVYCSADCQMNDWKQYHHQECKHAREIQSRRRASRWQYTHASRALHATLLEVIYADRSTAEHASRHLLPVFDPRSMGGMDRCSYTHNLLQDDGFWDRNSGPIEPHTFPGQDYLRPRLTSLMKEYTSGQMPPEWRLVEGILPLLGDELGIQLIVLLKPVDGKLKSVYSVARYGYRGGQEEQL